MQRDADSGELPGRIDIYLWTHQRRTGEWTVGSQKIFVCNLFIHFMLLGILIFNINYNFILQDRMIDIRSQPTPEGSTPPTDAQICDQVLGTRPCYIRGLGHGIRGPSSSRSTGADIHVACDARLEELQRQAEADRQRADQRAEASQQMMQQMMDRMQHMEQVIELMRQQPGPSSVPRSPSPVFDP